MSKKTYIRSHQTYIRTCDECGVTFEANHHRIRLCSEECRAERLRIRQAAKYHADPDKARAIAAKSREKNRDQINNRQNLARAAMSKSVKAEAKRWKPILDEVELKPDNLFLIQALVDELTSDSDLAWLLDWYWLSDATEYLEQQGYEHE